MCLAVRRASIFQPIESRDQLKKAVIHEAANLDDSVVGSNQRGSAQRVVNSAKGSGTDFNASLRPLSAWHSPAESEFRARESGGGGGFH
jgi:hypothetical protein